MNGQRLFGGVLNVWGRRRRGLSLTQRVLSTGSTALVWCERANFFLEASQPFTVSLLPSVGLFALFFCDSCIWVRKKKKKSEQVSIAERPIWVMKESRVVVVGAAVVAHNKEESAKRKGIPELLLSGLSVCALYLPLLYGTYYRLPPSTGAANPRLSLILSMLLLNPLPRLTGGGSFVVRDKSKKQFPANCTMYLLVYVGEVDQGASDILFTHMA